MKGTGHLVLRLYFLITILLCFGIEVIVTNNSTDNYSIEIPSELSYTDNNILTGIDSSEDDHLNQAQPMPEFGVQPTIYTHFSDPSTFKEFTFSSWKPPRYS